MPGCPAHCPVRPATFGYYDTQWRTWPGHGIEQVSRTEPAAPVMPPKSEVPKADEESPVPGFDSAQGDATEAAASDQQRRAQPSILPPPNAGQGTETEPPSEAKPSEPKPSEPKPSEAKPSEAKPSEAKPSEPKPSEPKPSEPKPSQEKSGDANLFDEANLRRRSQERLAMLGQAALQQERLRREAIRQQAKRLMQSSPPGGAVKPATHIGPDAR